MYLLNKYKLYSNDFYSKNTNIIFSPSRKNFFFIITGGYFFFIILLLYDFLNLSLKNKKKKTSGLFLIDSQLFDNA